MLTFVVRRYYKATNISAVHLGTDNIHFVHILKAICAVLRCFVN